MSCTLAMGLRHHILAPYYGACAGSSPPGGRNFLREFWPVYGAGANPAS